MTIEAQAESPKEPIGLGGWMILPILGMFLTLVMAIPVIGGDLQDFSSDFFSKFSPTQKTFAFLVFFTNLLFVGAWICALYLCFSWSERFPKFYMVLLAANLVVPVLELTIAAIFYDYNFTGEDRRDFGRSFVSCLIWIPYMMRSKRVRNTFKRATSPPTN